VTQKPTSASGQRWRSFAVEPDGHRTRVPASQEAFDLGAEFLLPLGEIIGNVLRERVGHALAEQRLLAFEQELLVAQRAHRQPREHQARQQDRHHKNQRDFFSWVCFGKYPKSAFITKLILACQRFQNPPPLAASLDQK